MRPTCCVEQCDDLAVGEIQTQWSIFDFMNHPACGPHMEHVYQVISRSQIDGQLPLFMSTNIWADLDDP